MSYLAKILSDTEAEKATRLERYEASLVVTQTRRAELDEVNDALTVIRLAKEEADRLKAGADETPAPVPIIESIKSIATPAAAEVVKSEPVDAVLAPLPEGSPAQRLVDLIAKDIADLTRRHPKGLTTTELAEAYGKPKASVAAALAHLKAKGLVRVIIGGPGHPRFLAVSQASAA